MSYGLGVDLGTTFTRAAISRGGQARMVALAEKSVLLPSVVMVAEDGTLTAGNPGDPEADQTRIGRDFKRRVGDPTPLVIGGQPHSAVSLLAATLRSVLEILTAAEGEPPSQVVLTYPAVWGPYRREHFVEVPRQAGLEHVTVLTEPEAAASHYAARQRLAKGDVVAVYDLGGGTFDTTVARKTATGVDIVGVPEGVEWVGGIDFDEAVLAHVDRQVGGAFSALDPQDPAAAIALRRIREECIRAKERLSRDDSTNIAVMLPNRHTQVRLTRAEFEGMIAPALEATLAALHRTLESASVTPRDLAGILLVGGSSRIPLVSRMLSRDLGRPVLVDQHPQHIVALGAGAIAGRLLTEATPVIAPRRGYRPNRRALAAATAAVMMIAGGSYLFTAHDPASDEGGRVAGLEASTYTGSTLNGTPTGRPTTTATSTPTPTASPTSRRPSTSRPKTSATRPAARTTAPKPKTITPKSPSLPRTATVLAAGGTCLDVANAQSLDGQEIQVSECNGTAAQVWNLRADHTFRALDKCMQAFAGAERAVQLQDCTGSAAQRWTMSGKRIIGTGSELCLEVSGAPTGHGTALTLSTCTTRTAQRWSLSS